MPVTPDPTSGDPLQTSDWRTWLWNQLPSYSGNSQLPQVKIGWPNLGNLFTPRTGPTVKLPSGPGFGDVFGPGVGLPNPGFHWPNQITPTQAISQGGIPPNWHVPGNPIRTGPPDFRQQPFQQPARPYTPTPSNIGAGLSAPQYTPPLAVPSAPAAAAPPVAATPAPAAAPAARPTARAAPAAPQMPSYVTSQTGNARGGGMSPAQGGAGLRDVMFPNLDDPRIYRGPGNLWGI